MTQAVPLHRALADRAPAVSMKRAWRALIQRLRVAASGAERSPYAKRAAIERARSTLVDPTDPRLGDLKSALARVVHEESAAAAEEAASWLAALAPLPLAPDERVHVSLRRRPPGMSATTVAALLGTDSGHTTAVEAAQLRHRLEGRVVGGVALSLSVSRGPLPAVPRDARADKDRWGRGAPWLPHVDDVGQHSLTPRAIAARMAQRAPGTGRVVDAGCGVGGSTVAFALAGRRVLALEQDPHRASLAVANARALGVASLVTVRCVDADADAVLDDVLGDGDLLFADPPWQVGGARALDFDALLAPLPTLRQHLESWPQVMLKLPSAFDVDTLPQGFLVCYELGEPETGDAQVVRMITAWRGT